jgi:hypothetical protein
MQFLPILWFPPSYGGVGSTRVVRENTNTSTRGGKGGKYKAGKKK